MSTEYAFSHYEKCFEEGGWTFLKAWYVNRHTGEQKYLRVD